MSDNNLQKTSTMEEFRKYAELINQIEDLNFELKNELSGDVPKNVHHPGWDKIDEGISKLKSDLEYRMAKEHRDEWTIDVFYGDNE